MSKYKYNLIYLIRQLPYESCKIIDKVGLALQWLLVAVIFCGCEDGNKYQQRVEVLQYNDYEITDSGVQILTIDSCEYIWVKAGYGAGLSHKGNCQFCAKK